MPAGWRKSISRPSPPRAAPPDAGTPMFLKIASFEFRYQVRSPVFWVAVVLFFLLSFATLAVDQIHVGGDNTNLHRNAPYTLGMTHMIMALFFMFASTSIVANVVVRDDETGYGAILRSSRITRFDYLYGRFTGAFAAVAIAYLAVPVGCLLGSLAPWLDRDLLGPVRLSDLVYDYVALGLPTVFLTSALFFSLATATRSMMATYLGVVALLMVWSGALAVTDKPELERLMAVVEPFGLGAYSFVSKYWTVAERNSLNVPMTGIVLLSRAIWMAVALSSLATAYAVYRFEVSARPDRRDRKDREPDTRPAPRLHAVAPATAHRDAVWTQFVARTRFDMGQVFRSPAFFVLILLGAFNALNALWFAPGPYGVDVYPVTRVSIDILSGSFTFIPALVAVYYAGELVWRERDRRTEEIIDSTPAPDWVFAAPKILAIAGVLVVSLMFGVVMAVLVQALKGWPDFELAKYLLWYVAPTCVTLVLTAILAVFVQTLVPHKFWGFGVMLVYLIVMQALSSLHFEDLLYRYGGAPPVPLSDMNGEGRFGMIRFWFRSYWGAVGAILVLLTYALWRRGRTDSLWVRVRALPRRLAGVAGLAMAGAVCLAAALGSFIFYNTHVLNAYRTAEAEDIWTADLEKTLLHFESVPQPKITDVQLRVDLDPHENRAMTRGVYRLENRTGAAVRELHVRFAHDLNVISLSVEGARPKTTFERFNYRIFTFDTPMEPGEHRTVSFQTRRAQTGFRNSDNGWTRIADNGTFLDDKDISPSIGMSRDGLLQDRAKRRKYGLPPQLRMPRLEDEGARRFSMIGKDSDWVNADITVSTVADQTPMAPGYKVSESVVDGRRIARFRTEAPILRFFSIQSAAYAVKTENYKGIELSIYHHPGHGWNVDRMLRALEVGLDYNQANFSPYQFRQVRILEFPAYADFAQSFANTIPYSENLGWIIDARNPEKIDMVSYVTAHELGHQWWAHQLIGGDMQGSTMLDETLAQYSALMATEKLYGPAQIHKFLKFELDHYLRARGGDLLEELPLERVENQGYIHYRKGALVMYRLKEELGEDRVNAALRELLRRYAFRGAPYPTSRELVQLFRAQARPDQQQLITDLFEKITLYDLKAKSATARRRPDGRYDVNLTYEAHKTYADGQGRETAAPMNDTVEIGVFTQSPVRDGFTERDVIRVDRARIVEGVHTLTVITDRRPTVAGIDPYTKLIDRNSDDNIIPVTH
jgi:aminopeptidase N